MPRSTIASVLSPTRLCDRPSICATMVPALGRTMPMMQRISVLLPLPLVPSSATVSDARTSSDTSSRTRTAPYPAWTPLMVMLSAKVGFLHLGVAHDLRGIAVGDLATGYQNDKPLRKAHHGAHDVLDQNDGDAPRIELHQQFQHVLNL